MLCTLNQKYLNNKRFLMQIVQFFSDGTICFNWEQLPENIRCNIELRDNIFQELQEKFKVNDTFTSKILFEMNRYVINRIVSEFRLKTNLKK